MFSIQIHICHRYLISKSTDNILFIFISVPRRTKPKSLIVCENRGAYLKCPRGKAISVAFASFGRTDPTMCRNGRGIKWGKKNKRSARKNIRRYFTRIARGRKKIRMLRRKVKRAVRTNLRKNRKNETSKKFTRKQGVSSSNDSNEFTRMYGTICRGDYRNDKDVIKDQCQNKAKCRVKANVKWFGEPCAGVQKYLTVIYWCF